MENPPFEDVFPIQDGDFPLLCVFTGGYFIFPFSKVGKEDLRHVGARPGGPGGQGLTSW